MTASQAASTARTFRENGVRDAVITALPGGVYGVCYTLAGVGIGTRTYVAGDPRTCRTCGGDAVYGQCYGCADSEFGPDDLDHR